MDRNILCARRMANGLPICQTALVRCKICSKSAIKIERSILPTFHWYLKYTLNVIPFSDVMCSSPPDIVGGNVISPTLDLYYFTVVVEYECHQNYSVMEGNSQVTCMINGNWSHARICHRTYSKRLNGQHQWQQTFGI